MIAGVPESALDAIRAVLRKEPRVERAVVFGSRALGTHRPGSDIDLAVFGEMDDQAVAHLIGELEQLPHPWLFDVVAMNRLRDISVRAHIERVAVEVYCRESSAA